MRRGGILAVVAALIGIWHAPAARADEAARQAQLRLLCVRLSGDLTDPGGMAAFRRCMASRQPLNTIRQNMAPPHRRLDLVAHRQVDLTPGAAPASSYRKLPVCGHGLVWRGATGGDHACVTPQFHAAIASDNAHAALRVAGPGDACKQGFVWREATPSDHVCVPPATRALVRAQNGGR